MYGNEYRCLAALPLYKTVGLHHVSYGYRYCCLSTIPIRRSQESATFVIFVKHLFTFVALSRPSSFRRVATALSKLNPSFTARASPTGTGESSLEIIMTAASNVRGKGGDQVEKLAISDDREIGS